MNSTTSSGRPTRSTTRRVVIGVTAATLAVVGVTGCDPDAEDAAAATAVSVAKPAPSVRWGTCPALPEGAPRDPRLTCATVKVPLDYSKPKGPSIDVAISRLPTADARKRKGVLLLNPGGPALPGLDMPGEMAKSLPKTVLDSYDLIGFDPRGVGHSTPQTCGLEDTTPDYVFPYPAADGSITANVEYARSTAKACLTTAGTKLRYFTTANTARDLDGIRAALGQAKISYWGQSYGTYLGTVYGTLFPQRVDRMILEGNVDPTHVWADEAKSWGKGMAERFPDAAAVAAAQDDTLGLGDSVAEVTQSYLALADRLDRDPAPVPGTQQALTGPLLRDLTYSLLLHNETVPVLTQLWKAASDLSAGHLTDADGEVLQQIFAATPPTPGVPVDNQVAMFLALTCGDAKWSNDVDSYAAEVAADRKAWPITAGMPANIRPCAFWPAPIAAPVTVSATGPRNILILQNRRDNATTWDSALGLHQALGRRSALVGVDNGGHYVYHEGSTCADQATVAFLTTGHLPDQDVNCTDVTPN